MGVQERPWPQSEDVGLEFACPACGFKGPALVHVELGDAHNARTRPEVVAHQRASRILAATPCPRCGKTRWRSLGAHLAGQGLGSAALAGGAAWYLGAELGLRDRPWGWALVVLAVTLAPLAVGLLEYRQCRARARTAVGF